MKTKITHILLTLLIIVGLLNLRNSTSVVDSQFVRASFSVARTVGLAPGDTVNCPTYLIPLSIRSARCADLPVTATPSRTPAPSQTPVTVTVSPTEHAHDPTVTPLPDGELQVWEVWHAPGAHLLPDGMMSNVHEHGHEPPDWVNEFSLANFGHPLIYGGDEKSGEMEVTHKHQAYGGFDFSFSPNGCRVDGYLRYHASSTPADRSVSLHSFEIYVRDCAGNISFNQGVYWTGDPSNPAQRMCRADEVTNGRDQYIIAGRCINDTAISEQWYTHFINWDFSLTLLNATTYFEYGEHLLDPMNPDTWQLTGRDELSLRVEITSLPNPRVTLPRNYNYPRDAWWCAQHLPTIGTRRYTGRTLPFPYWQITGAVASPDACPAGFLPQYNASTMPPLYADGPGGNTIPRIFFDGAGVVEVPN